MQHLQCIRSPFVHQMRNIAHHIPFHNRVKQECLRLSNVPLLSSIVKQYESIQPLKHYSVLNIQHELGDVSAQVEALIRLGALPKHVYFLPPSYSHNKQFEAFLAKHFHIPKENLFDSSSYRLRYNYDKYRLMNVLVHLKQMIQLESMKTQNQSNNLLILDDGGCFSEAITILFDIEENKLDPNELSCNLPSTLELSERDAKLILSFLKTNQIRLVEQTSRGLFKYIDQPKIPIALKKLGISIVDVATSEPKKRLESVIIAETCLNMLSYLFYDAPAHLKIPKPSKNDQCLLLGYGAIGQAIAYALTHGGDLGMFSKDSVYIWDTDMNKRTSAESDGFRLFNQWDKTNEFNYIIGCAGRCSLSMSSLSLLRNSSYLISVSSAAIEFPFHEMIQYASERRADDIQIRLSKEEFDKLNDEDIHRNIKFLIENSKEITVVNGGMPITFLGILNPTVPEKFDLTISLMVAASIQATLMKLANDQENRIIPLNTNFSNFICNWFETRKSVEY
ncbi:unnamed protein product [Adineta ricciae]|uniref:Uncharacterized protein n=1 Tax=Adineta ricciae TaxID=249248 RepID=A0A814V7R8_ADIRI|nr:unnamed protein product [Adineta ricciae]CAF1183683.1 unnamed protein product [Adineta ricciae]